MKKIKIAHISSAHPDLDVRIFHKECVSLANHIQNEAFELEVHLILAGVQERLENNVHIHSVPRILNSRLKRMWNTVNEVYKKAVEVDADIYHLHDPELLRIALKLKRKGKKVIYDSHEDLPKQVMDKHWIPMVFRKLISNIIAKYEAYVAKRIDAVVSVNEPICNRFKKANTNVAMIANYPLNTEATLLEGLNLTRNTKQICYIGGLFPTRGIKELILAMEQVDATLVLAGSFSPADFETEVKALPGWSKVDYRGFINRTEILEILKTSILGVVTLHPTKSYVESLPIKMFEYMSAGIPVLASDFEMWKTIIETEDCGICVDPLDVDQIANGLNFFLNNTDIASEKGLKGLNSFKQKYNWKAEEVKLAYLYEQLILK